VQNVRKPHSLAGADVVALAGALEPEIVIPTHWVQGDTTFGDEAEIEYIRRSIPGGTAFRILELTPPML
jgi:hypothetical protein